MSYPDDLEWNQPGVEPTQAKKDEGWKPEEKPPAEYFNWFFNRTCRAVKFLRTESDKSIGDEKIGDRTIDDSIPVAAGAGTITNLLSKLGNMVKQITGKSNWYTAPATTLETANTHITATSGAHTASAISSTATGDVAATNVQAAIVELASEKAALSGATFTGAINETAVTMASAATMNIGAAAGNLINVTGTTAITAFDTAQAGTRRKLRFASVLTVTYNATSLILSGGASITVSAGDVIDFISLGSGNWFGIYQPFSGGVSLSNFTGGNQNKAANGWQKLPGGLIIQWGHLAVTSRPGNSLVDDAVSVVFPITFPTSCLNVNAAIEAPTASLSNNKWLQIISFDASSCNLFFQDSGAGAFSVGIYYFAIGY